MPLYLFWMFYDYYIYCQVELGGIRFILYRSTIPVNLALLFLTAQSLESAMARCAGGLRLNNEVFNNFRCCQ